MDTVKAYNNKKSATEEPKRELNPFAKLAEDKERIADAVNKDQPLTSLKDIKFIRPV